IGLLKPQRVESNGYRTYGERELLLLQQILFFRELDFPLQEIRRILESPDFDLLRALEDHKQLLKIKRKRLDRLVGTIDRTITSLTNKSNMNDKDLYLDFSNEEAATYAEEAKQRWGHTKSYKQSVERVSKLSKKEMEQIQKDNEDLLREIVLVMDKAPESKEVQALIKRHYEWLGAFYDPEPEMYKGLGELYVQDERFSSYFDRFAPGLAEFMRKAMAF